MTFKVGNIVTYRGMKCTVCEIRGNEYRIFDGKDYRIGIKDYELALSSGALKIINFNSRKLVFKKKQIQY
jgi:hypothetical protein